MKCYAKNIVKLALAEVGYCEKETNANLEHHTLNSGSKNWNKYADFIDTEYPEFYNGRKNGYDWCDIFVDYLFLKSFGLDNALKLLCQPLKSGGAGCTASRSYYKKANRYSKSPSIGAQIFFTKDAGKSCYHTGIVYSVDTKRVYTVEGNSGNKVATKSYYLTDSKIDGYGCPEYDKNLTQEGGVKQMKSDTEIAAEVIAGKWGSGADRKNALIAAGYNADNVQSIVNAMLKGEVATGKTFIVNIEKNKYKQIIINLI